MLSPIRRGGASFDELQFDAARPAGGSTASVIGVVRRTTWVESVFYMAFYLSIEVYID